MEHNLTIILVFNFLLILQINGIKSSNAENDISIEPRIVNGTDASLSASGHQVSIRRRSKKNVPFGDDHICGGSLISENVVLTAAHCFVDGSAKGTFLPDKDFIVAMGTVDRTKPNHNTLVFNDIKTVKHDENFNVTTLVDDIALIFLNGTVPANHPTIKPITLNDGSIRNNTLCQVTGWGINENTVLPEKLQIVYQPFVDFEDCGKMLDYGSILQHGMICAGDVRGGRGVCSADSGGPLVCRGNQIGVLSWSMGCAKPLAPAVYTDIASYKDWILKEVAIHNGTLPKFASIPDHSISLSSSAFLVILALVINFVCNKFN